ncbi:MAG: DNA replication/repair protein RecF [Chloroflexi bacterium]|nr:DNA replication/repair protein RecF [Chloroflexota bacterium]
MHISHLSLTNFRNYAQLELALSPGLVVLWGGNGEGKTNFLEAIYFLATSRSPRATTEGELVHWDVWNQDLPVTRLTAQVHRSDGEVRLEVALRGLSKGPEREGEDAPRLFDHGLWVQKHIRVNGLPTRAADLMGRLIVVLFNAPDMDMVGGAPTLRRRCLDVLNSQADVRYLRTLQRYQRVVTQRNYLLRALREGQAARGELDFWDEELVKNGAYLVARRHQTLAALNPLTQEMYRSLSPQEGELRLVHLCPLVEETAGPDNENPSSIQDRFRKQLDKAYPREVAQGMTLVGPHRDDFLFLGGGRPMGLFASRGQQRALTLAFKLAEAQLLKRLTGELPVLLLDDVLSELDAPRRRHLLEAIAPYHQVFITTTDVAQAEAAGISQARLLEVEGGNIP